MDTHDHFTKCEEEPLLLRHVTPLARRNVVYFCSGAYSAAFAEGKRYFQQQQDITASQLFEYAVSLAKKFGWEFGGSIAGHLIGQFPHEKIAGDKVTLYIHPDSHLPMRSLNEKGQRRHWVLEIHFVDREHEMHQRSSRSSHR